MGSSIFTVIIAEKVALNTWPLYVGMCPLLRLDQSSETTEHHIIGMVDDRPLRIVGTALGVDTCCPRDALFEPGAGAYVRQARDVRNRRAVQAFVGHRAGNQDRGLRPET